MIQIHDVLADPEYNLGGAQSLGGYDTDWYTRYSATGARSV